MTREGTIRTVAVLVVVAMLGGAGWATGARRPAPNRERVADGELEYRSGEIVVEGSPQAIGPNYRVIRYYPRSNLSVVAVNRGFEKSALAGARGLGRRAGLNLRVEAFGAVNDPYFPYQWNLTNVQAEAAWDVTDGSGAVVAVLDTGIRQGGEADGVACVLPGYNALDDSTNVTDGHGHGTHVSGTVAQSTNNAIGAAGLAFGACVLPVKVLDDTGFGDLADLAEGVYWAVDNGAQVINMSLGLSAAAEIFNDPILDPALDYAFDNDVTVVVASGNEGYLNNVSYPATYPSTIAVGAVDVVNAVTGYSNRGTGLDVVAPGGDTNADLNGDYLPDGVLQETYAGSGWSYYFYQGTSMASPHVAAVAAMLYANGTASTPAGVLTALTSTALDLGPAGFDSEYGFGLVQAYDALLAGGGSCTDADDDGWCVSDNDCDDSDASVNPGAAEVCFDAIDNNCDGAVDEGCNTPPQASSDHDCTGLDCSFTDLSSDVDGQVVAWMWDFGDGTTSTEQNPAHVYSAPGTYNCNLAVTDDQGGTDVASAPVDVTAPAQITLDNFTHEWGSGIIDVILQWSGATTRVDIYKNGILWRWNQANTGSRNSRWWPPIPNGSASYEVCETGTSICSNESYVVFCDGSPECAGNQAPEASSVHLCQDLDCSFTDLSVDVDGQVVAWQWDFGDGTTSTEQNPTHIYAVEGTYNCNLVVTDDEGAVGAASALVRVPTPEITLDSSIHYWGSGIVDVNLQWSGATTKVDIYKNGVLWKWNHPNTGNRTSRFWPPIQPGWVTYQVCETDTSVCSDEISVLL